MDGEWCYRAGASLTAVSFGLWLDQAQLRDRQSSPRLDRIEGSRSDDGLERGIQAYGETSIAMKLLGDSMGPIVWDVFGNSCPLRDHVSRQTGRKVNVHAVKGRLIVGLDLLATH